MPKSPGAVVCGKAGRVFATASAVVTKTGVAPERVDVLSQEAGDGDEKAEKAGRYLLGLGTRYAVILAVTHAPNARDISGFLGGPTGMAFGKRVPVAPRPAECFVFELPDTPSAGKPEFIEQLKP
jgi:hypothetical protein